MVNTKKQSAVNAKLCQGKDVFERINFLYQASTQMVQKNKALASYYGSILTSCAKKSVLRLDHNLKRSICKSCHCPLIPGETSIVRTLKKKKKLIKVTCIACKQSKKFPMKKKYNLWIDKNEAVVEEFNYDLKPNDNPSEKTSESTESTKTNIG